MWILLLGVMILSPACSEEDLVDGSIVTPPTEINAVKAAIQNADVKFFVLNVDEVDGDEVTRGISSTDSTVEYGGVLSINTRQKTQDLNVMVFDSTFYQVGDSVPWSTDTTMIDTFTIDTSTQILQSVYSEASIKTGRAPAVFGRMVKLPDSAASSYPGALPFHFSQGSVSEVWSVLHLAPKSALSGNPNHDQAISSIKLAPGYRQQDDNYMFNPITQLWKENNNNIGRDLFLMMNCAMDSVRSFKRSVPGYFEINEVDLNLSIFDIIQLLNGINPGDPGYELRNNRAFMGRCPVSGKWFAWTIQWTSSSQREFHIFELVGLDADGDAQFFPVGTGPKWSSFSSANGQTTQYGSATAFFGFESPHSYSVDATTDLNFDSVNGLWW